VTWATKFGLALALVIHSAAPAATLQSHSRRKSKPQKPAPWQFHRARPTEVSIEARARSPSGKSYDCRRARSMLTFFVTTSYKNVTTFPAKNLGKTVFVTTLRPPEGIGIPPNAWSSSSSSPSFLDVGSHSTKTDQNGVKRTKTDLNLPFSPADTISAALR
jgi:hypothetical protein